MNTANNSKKDPTKNNLTQPVVIDGYIDWIECPMCGRRVDGVGICFACGNTNLPDIKK